MVLLRPVARPSRCTAAAKSAARPCRTVVRAVNYQGSGQVTAVVITPSRDMAATEKATKTFGQAFITNSWSRALHARLGKEQEVFAGLSRMMLDTFSDDEVLFVTGCGNAAAITLTDTQQAHLTQNLQAMDFSVIPGTLQMLTAIPEDSMPAVRAELAAVHAGGLGAIQQAAGQPGPYLQVMMIGVQPASQGKGLGSALMSLVAKRAADAGMPLLVEAPSDDLVPFFQRQGLQVISRRDGLRPLLVKLPDKAQA